LVTSGFEIRSKLKLHSCKANAKKALEQRESKNIF